MTDLGKECISFKDAQSTLDQSGFEQLLLASSNETYGDLVYKGEKDEYEVQEEEITKNLKQVVPILWEAVCTASKYTRNIAELTVLQTVLASWDDLTCVHLDEKFEGRDGVTLQQLVSPSRFKPHATFDKNTNPPSITIRAFQNTATNSYWYSNSEGVGELQEDPPRLHDAEQRILNKTLGIPNQF